MTARFESLQRVAVSLVAAAVFTAVLASTALSLAPIARSASERQAFPLKT